MGRPGPPAGAGYLNDVATGYGAGVAQVPLLSDPGRAAQEISQAVAAATRGRIPHLLPPGSLNDIGGCSPCLDLNAAWSTPFDAADTRPGPFTTAAGRRSARAS